ILNNESHQEDDYKGITDKNIDKYLTLTEKIKTARLVIIFLYKLDKMHVVKHLSNIREASEIAKIIESWEQDILNLMN
ncbi:hypothetical protein, partial [Staphylococcus kloosii]|uniref:hypothetical protein n=1 Tax=Staphylococcus kloosii TaxID=29384 RepID=UPI000D4D8048